MEPAFAACGRNGVEKTINAMIICDLQTRIQSCEGDEIDPCNLGSCDQLNLGDGQFAMFCGLLMPPFSRQW
jgi:hypothetical protein